MPKTVILGTARTPFGKMGGAPRRRSTPTDLGGHAIEAALERAEVAPGPGQHVIFGPGAPGRPGPDPLAPGPDQGRDPEGGLLRDRQQGLRLRHARGRHDRPARPRRRPRGRRRGRHGVDVAARPTCCRNARFGYRMGDAKALDAMVHDGLTNPFTGKQMFVEATEVGDELEMTRADLDKFALRSHELAIQATDEGRLRRGDRAGHDQLEEGRHGRRGRRGAAPRQLARGAGQAARPDRQGRLAHGRQLARRERRRRRARARQRRVGEGRTASRSLATIVGQAAVADDFPYLARTPANATKLALEKAGLTVDDIDLFEINEAFASVAINSMRMLGVDEAKVNVNGGAIALGHPIGASRRAHPRRARARAAPPRRRPRRRGDLLRRRPGRRDDPRGQRRLSRRWRLRGAPPSSTSTRP